MTDGFKTRKYLPSFLAAVLAFAVGVTTIYLFARDDVKNIFTYNPIHSSENNSPYSVLEGATVRIKSYNATFEIPESWLTPNPVPPPAKNLHLSYEDLNQLYWNDGFDEEEAQVINSVLPFEDCAAHVGDKGWGNYLWNDLQGRVYVAGLTPEEIDARIEQRGLKKALSVFERASLTAENHGIWQKRTLNILDAPSHFMLNKNLDFYYRSYGGKTVVIVFLHADSFDKEINLILDSFKWSIDSASETNSGRINAK